MTKTIIEAGAEGNDLYATDEHWTCEFEDNVRRQLGVYVEIMDFYEATGDEKFAECPWMVQFEILPHEPSRGGRAFDDETLECIDEAVGTDLEYRHERMREHLKGYGGGVPLTRQITTGISAPGKELPTPTGKVEGDDPVWPMFEKYEDAKAYAKALLEQRVEGLMCLIGFVLDQPYNGMGDTGWDLLRPAVMEVAA